MESPPGGIVKRPLSPEELDGLWLVGFLVLSLVALWLMTHLGGAA